MKIYDQNVFVNLVGTCYLPWDENWVYAIAYGKQSLWIDLGSIPICILEISYTSGEINVHKI